MTNTSPTPINLTRNYTYPSVVEILKIEIYKLEYGENNNKYLPENIDKLKNIVREVKEIASTTYKTVYKKEDYNIFLTFIRLTVKHEISLIDGKVYTMSLRVEHPKFTFNCYGDCFFECLDAALMQVFP